MEHTMFVTVLYFAQARERAGRAEETLELRDGSRLSDATGAIRERHPELRDLWEHLAVAADGVLAPGDSELRDGAEIALLPPVSGG
jgi:molybdopterin synthase catalytic subunit